MCVSGGDSIAAVATATSLFIDEAKIALAFTRIKVNDVSWNILKAAIGLATVVLFSKALYHFWPKVVAGGLHALFILTKFDVLCALSVNGIPNHIRIRAQNWGDGKAVRDASLGITCSYADEGV
ncbi:hypothetical protein GJ496_011437 [Pomphorhynchus laevis]|nr:hypothetical protein GJ496_011437 [Pomphorhynchus laevis]